MVDEMSQGLAPSVVDDLFEIVARFPDMGTSVLVVEQFVDRALALSSRAYVLDKGKVAYDGDSATLAADEKFVRGSYLGEVDDATVGVGSTSRAGGHDARGEAGRDGLARALTEDVRVSLPPVMLRSLQQRADTEGVALEELLRDMVESADRSEAPRSEGPRFGVKRPAGRPRPLRPARPAGTSASRRPHDD
jgi:ABC-type multidrug transport system ATPase subunit